MKLDVYVFMVQRQQDRDVWPCVYLNAALAHKALGRISAVVPVTLDTHAPPRVTFPSATLPTFSGQAIRLTSDGAVKP